MTRPSASARRTVRARAGRCCEYCLIHEEFGAAAHQVDHVVAEKHGGATSLANLALSCVVCNRRKGSDIASIDPETGRLVPLFNPRLQRWSEHFRLAGARIVGRTPRGRATVHLLQLNSDERLLERRELVLSGLYPPETRTPKGGRR